MYWLRQEFTPSAFSKNVNRRYAEPEFAQGYWLAIFNWSIKLIAFAHTIFGTIVVGFELYGLKVALSSTATIA